MSDYKIVIPARYGSSRLPGKPLIMLAGKPMIQHVFERAKSTQASEIIIATDDQRIFDAAKGFGAEVVMTSPDHENGTERIAEVAGLRDWLPEDVIVNLQGDEPLIPVELIELTAQGLIMNAQAGMSSLCTVITDAKDLFNPNVVKVVTDNSGFAMYFSRAPIPYDRELYKLGQQAISEIAPAYRHIGMYGYRVAFLQEYKGMDITHVERAESLEQLRALCYGVKIHMTVIDKAPGHGVDTFDDIALVEAQLALLEA